VSDSPIEPPSDSDEGEWAAVDWVTDADDSDFYTDGLNVDGSDDDEFGDAEFGDDDESSGEPFIYEATMEPGDAGMAELLSKGTIELLGLMPWSSNGAYLVQVRLGDDFAPAVYKPESGELPLWDFPAGLWRREVASYELSEALGFSVVPPTVSRLDAGAGPGSVQAFVPAQFEHHYFTLREDPDHAVAFRQLCAFDLVANSTDRKGGHCLTDANGRIWAIDNGLTFHVEFKIRTVIWDFAGERLPGTVADALDRLISDGLPASMEELLDPDERANTLHRARGLLASAEFPYDRSGRRYPWPLV